MGRQTHKQLPFNVVSADGRVGAGWGESTDVGAQKKERLLVSGGKVSGGKGRKDRKMFSTEGT